MQEEVDAFLEEFWPERTWPIDIEAIVDSRAGLDIVNAQGIVSAYDIDGFLSNDMSTIYVDEYWRGVPHSTDTVSPWLTKSVTGISMRNSTLRHSTVILRSSSGFAPNYRRAIWLRTSGKPASSQD